MAEFKWLGNYRKTNKSAFLAAREESGKAVEWKDNPATSSDIPSSTVNDEYGSMWSSEADLSAFWSAFSRKLGDV